MKKILQSINTKIILVIIISILPLNLLGLVSSNRAMKSLVEQTRLSISNVSDIYATLLNKRMFHADYQLYHIRTRDQNGIEMFKQDENSSYFTVKYRLASMINNQLALYNGADCYYFYMPKMKDMLICAKSGNYDDTQNLKRYLNNIENLESKLNWHLKDIDGALWLIRCMYVNGFYCGAAISLNSVLDEIKKNINYNGCHISFSTRSFQPEEENSIFISSNIKNSNTHLNISVNRQEVLKSISVVIKNMTIVALILLLTIPFLFMLLQYYFIKPLSKLNYAHSQLKSGNQEYRIKGKANTTEIQKAFDSFNSMADRIVNLKIENMGKEIAKQKMKLKNLQLQIRPHFLLNTFNLICILGKKNKTNEVLDLVMYLSDYFRYIFINGKEVDLFSKELQLIKKYLKIAAIRYPGRFQVNYDIEPETEFVHIPPLLIHNFVENAIQHALKEDDITHISLISEYENKMVRFRIIDDGKGMSKEVFDKVVKLYFSDDNPDVQTHIGLHNAYVRVKYFYGEQADIEVISKLGEGTCFTINIPFDLEDYDETIDCE